jgi:hypothetical protein
MASLRFAGELTQERCASQTGARSLVGFAVLKVNHDRFVEIYIGCSL